MIRFDLIWFLYLSLSLRICMGGHWINENPISLKFFNYICKIIKVRSFCNLNLSEMRSTSYVHYIISLIKQSQNDTLDRKQSIQLLLPWVIYLLSTCQLWLVESSQVQIYEVWSTETDTWITNLVFTSYKHNSLENKITKSSCKGFRKEENFWEPGNNLSHL